MVTKTLCLNRRGLISQLPFLETEKRVTQLVEFTNAVMTILAKNLGKDSASLQVSDRLDELGLNSLEMFSVTFDLEEKFNILIEYDNSSRLKPITIADLIEHVRELCVAKQLAKLV